eukprot:snap_masked-scaffold_7-processed-gene-9.11-mRNA-1 protein AED:1.00 eAED:1.00 QI:0/-1/0/0/-1/1/1/0/669
MNIPANLVSLQGQIQNLPNQRFQSIQNTSHPQGINMQGFPQPQQQVNPVGFQNPQQGMYNDPMLGNSGYAAANAFGVNAAAANALGFNPARNVPNFMGGGMAQMSQGRQQGPMVPGTNLDLANLVGGSDQGVPRSSPDPSGRPSSLGGASTEHLSKPREIPGKGKNDRAGAKGKSTQNMSEEDKKALRRKKVAEASRATRAKRKREMEDLKQRNKRLEVERETFLTTIQELQVKIQSLRQSGGIDLRLENDLLKAELAEHKRFINDFKNIATQSPTKNSAKKVLIVQSSDTAVSQVLGLVASSMVDPSWVYGVCRAFPLVQLRFQRLPFGTSAVTAKRTTIRADFPFIPVKRDILAEYSWRKWNDPQFTIRMMNATNPKKTFSVKQVDVELDSNYNPSSGFRSGVVENLNPPLPTSNNLLANVEDPAEQALVRKSSTHSLQGVDDDDSDTYWNDRGRIKAYYSREFKQVAAGVDPGSQLVLHDQQTSQDISTFQDGTMLDSVMVVTGRHVKVNNSYFPGLVMMDKSQVQHHRLQAESKKNKSIESHDKLEGLSEAICIASTSTRDAIDYEPVCIGASQVRSAMLEGIILRERVLEAGPQGTAVTAVFSFPVNPDEKEQTFIAGNKPAPMVDADGYLSSAWENMLREVIEDFRNTFPGFSTPVAMNLLHQ